MGQLIDLSVGIENGMPAHALFPSQFGPNGETIDNSFKWVGGTDSPCRAIAEVA